MLNVIWHVARFFYVVGLILVAPFFLFLLVNVRDDPHGTAPYIMFGLLYFLLGFLLFKVVGDWMRNRLLARVSRFKNEGFTPQFEIESLIFDRYIGFDSKSERVLCVDVDGSAICLRFDEILEWKIVTRKSNPAVLKLLTRRADWPVISTSFSRRFFDAYAARIQTVLG
uniref:hypothetical protein n=1 Tax=Burkholderia diffusa TaxID=488732 RepID=UPI001CC684C4|nr:hypothetical protein [Burkholderia diffusa]